MSVIDRAGHLATARLSERLPGRGSDVQTILSGILRTADVAIVVGASFLAYWLWHGALALPSFYLTPTLLGALLAANFLHFLRAYSPEALRRPALQVGKAVAAWVAASAGLVAIAYLTSTSIIFGLLSSSASNLTTLSVACSEVELMSKTLPLPAGAASTSDSDDIST